MVYECNVLNLLAISVISQFSDFRAHLLFSVAQKWGNSPCLPFYSHVQSPAENIIGG